MLRFQPHGAIWALPTYNIAHDGERAKEAFDRALLCGPGDARILYERDQLWKRIGTQAQDRLLALQQSPALLEQRDDLAVAVATLYNQLNRPEEALDLLLKRKFQPWEGGEGLVLAQFSAPTCNWDNALLPPETPGLQSSILPRCSILRKAWVKPGICWPTRVMFITGWERHTPRAGMATRRRHGGRRRRGNAEIFSKWRCSRSLP